MRSHCIGLQEGSYAAASFDIEALHDVAAAVAAKAAIAQAMSGRLNELDAQIKVLASEATRISTKLSEASDPAHPRGLRCGVLLASAPPSMMGLDAALSLCSCSACQCPSIHYAAAQLPAIGFDGARSVGRRMADL